jgi:hypothetical protein
MLDTRSISYSQQKLGKNKDSRIVFSEQPLEDNDRRRPDVWIDPDYRPSEDDPGVLEDTRRNGTEALAWYILFHQSRAIGGIHFRLRGLAGFL